MEPIINPWIFYLIDFLAKLEKLLYAVFCVTSFVTVLLVIGGLAFGDEGPVKRIFKISFTIALISIIAITFIPSKETIYQMLIATYITPDNLRFFKDEAVNLVDYIISQIQILKN